MFAWRLSEYTSSFRAKTPILITHPTLDDLKELNMDPEMDLRVYPWEFLKDKTQSNTWKCVVAASQSKKVGYLFYSTKEMSFSGTKTVHFDLPPRSAYNFRIYVHPAYRKLSIQKALIDFTWNLQRSADITTTFACVNSTNRPSISNFLRTGGTVIGSVIFLKTAFFNKVIVSRSLFKTPLNFAGISTL